MMITGKLKYSKQDLAHLIHHRSYMDWHGIESGLGLYSKRPVANHLSHGMA
jgi:hypothetical protein